MRSFLLFSNLFPGRGLESHGSFIAQRTARLAERLGLGYSVLSPVPAYPPLPGRSLALRRSRLPRREQWMGVPVRRPRYLHLPGLGLGAQARRMARGARRVFERVLEEERPVLVDAQYLYPDAVAALMLLKGKPTPCLVTARGSDVNLLARLEPVRRQLQQWLPRARRVLAVSPALARSLEALVPGLQVEVAPNGVDLARFPALPAPAEPKGDTHLVSVGRLVPGKGAAVLLEALRLDPSLPPLRWLGEGPERRRLEKRVRALGLEGRVAFPGELPPEQVPGFLVRGSLFVFPSLREGWPNAVQEALAAGLPVVARAVGGIPDMLTGCPAAFLVPEEAGPEEWAAAIRRALAGEQQALRAAARARAEQLSWESMLNLWAPIYEELCRD